MNSGGPRLGYIVSRYPLVSETFILRELLLLQAGGSCLTICALRSVRGARHERTALLPVAFTLSPWSPRTWAAHGRRLRRQPWRYLSTLALALWCNASDLNLLAGAVVYWAQAVALAEEFERAGIEHIHAHYATHPALVAWIVHRFTSLPYSFTVHAHDLYCHRAMLARKVAAASFVVPISELNRRVLSQLPMPARARPMPVIHCGVELDRYEPRPPRTVGPLRLLTVGSLQAYKGHRFLLEALALLRERLAFECVIVGAGPLAGRLRRQARRRGLVDRVHWRGACTELEVRRELLRADLFVLPSVRAFDGQAEGIPVALMEAMASGLAVVASRLSGIPELVGHGREGFLVPPGDATALADAIFLLSDGQLRQRMGRAGRVRVEREFNLVANVGTLAQHFQRSAGEPATAASGQRCGASAGALPEGAA